MAVVLPLHEVELSRLSVTIQVAIGKKRKAHDLPGAGSGLKSPRKLTVPCTSLYLLSITTLLATVKSSPRQDRDTRVEFEHVNSSMTRAPTTSTTRLRLLPKWIEVTVHSFGRLAIRAILRGVVRPSRPLQLERI